MQPMSPGGAPPITYGRPFEPIAVRPRAPTPLSPLSPHSAITARAATPRLASPPQPIAARPAPATPVLTLDTRWATVALDGIDGGAVAVDAQRRVVFANRHARWAMQSGHPLAIVDGLLAGAGSFDPPGLGDAIRKACEQGLRRMLALECGEGPARHVVVMPLTAGLAMIWFERDEAVDALTLEGYARLHGLTAAETRVLARLAQGEAPTEIATAHGVGLATVRTQIHAIRMKTRTRHLRDLLQTLACLPPVAARTPRAAES